MNLFKSTLISCAALIALAAIVPSALAEQRIIKIFWAPYVQGPVQAEYFTVDWQSGEFSGAERIDDIAAGSYVFSADTNDQEIKMVLSAVSQFTSTQAPLFTHNLADPGPNPPTGIRAIQIRVTVQ